jgi:Tfp pilus assembly protein FimT
MLGPLNKSAGLTLIELMVTLAVLIILAATMVPAYSTLVQRNALTAAVNELSAQMQFARSESLKRNAAVTLCPSDDGAVCNNTTAWQSGAGSQDYLIFLDGGTKGQLDGTDLLVKQFTLNQTGLGVALASGPNNHLAFSSKGYLPGGASLEMDMDGSNDKCVSISVVGRTEFTAGACGG